MPKATAASSDRRTQVHTEVRAPIESILTRMTWFVFGAIETIIALIAWGIVALIAAVTPRTHAETVQRVESDEDVVVE